MVGRGSRISSGKSDFTLLDFGNNVKTHNYWEHPRQWSLKKKEKKEGAAPIKECPNCSFLLHAPIMVCPECGHQFEKSEEEKENKVIAELVLMTPSNIIALAQRSSIKELIQIQIARNYQKSWIFHYLKTADDFKEYGKLMKYHYKWAQHQIKLRNL
jgi:uncharacterized OB-fold protein